MSSVLVLLLTISVSGEQYSNVASIFELGMGARPLAMGGAFVGLADDGNALFYNPAGLAWTQDLSILSSYEARPGTASYGNLSSSFPHFGFGVHYFDFGEIPETDEFGNILGTFSYRNYALIAAAGVKAGDLPFLARMPLAENIGFGIGAKFLKVSTLEPGSGTGFVIDLSFLFRSESPSPRVPVITSYGFGLVIENLIGLPIKYESGHQENWPRKVIIGTSLELLDQVILAMDITSEKNIRLGVEWTPIPAVSFRTGLKYEDIWMWSLGMGTRFRNFAFDLAVVPHLYLNSQLRGSLVVSW
ncbi:PorV/PorQ family protein [Candidatus Bipolaricaulota bacterium]|nr:PorV/PorQ family protein [Candidatus Bipolaricaulota bacterium]